MTTKEILLEQFTACYDENGWFVALKNALQNLTAKQASRKPEAGSNSIWGIVRHLNFYNERYLRRFKGEFIPKVTVENSETFQGAEAATEDAWRAAATLSNNQEFDCFFAGSENFRHCRAAH